MKLNVELSQDLEIGWNCMWIELGLEMWERNWMWERDGTGLQGTRSVG